MVLAFVGTTLRNSTRLAALLLVVDEVGNSELGNDK